MLKNLSPRAKQNIVLWHAHSKQPQYPLFANLILQATEKVLKKEPIHTELQIIQKLLQQAPTRKFNIVGLIKDTWQSCTTERVLLHTGAPILAAYALNAVFMHIPIGLSTVPVGVALWFGIGLFDALACNKRWQQSDRKLKDSRWQFNRFQ